MYQAYAGRMGWKLEVLGSDPSDMGGFNDITFMLKGEGVWPRMHQEAGVHRVQRVPVTESQGRIHTSSATVMVLPEAEEVDVALEDKDLKFDVYRSSRSEEHTSELQSLLRISSAVFCLKKKQI